MWIRRRRFELVFPINCATLFIFIVHDHACLIPLKNHLHNLKNIQEVEIFFPRNKKYIFDVVNSPSQKPKEQINTPIEGIEKEIATP